MNGLSTILAVMMPLSVAHAGALSQLPSDGAIEAPAISSPRAALPDGLNVNALVPCPAGMKGDASAPCVVKTPKTTVCADGKRFSAELITAKDAVSGKYEKADIGKYKDVSLREWQAYQKKIGKNPHWGDSSHQNMLATGVTDPVHTAYVVLPNRQWLGRSVTVCLPQAGLCTEAKALEVGPASTFRDHSEVSVRVLMDLGLDANPDTGTYNGEVVFYFH